MLGELCRGSLLLLLASCISCAASSRDATGTTHISTSTVIAATDTDLSIGTSARSRPSNSTCISGTVNYITHTLPQQCLATQRRPVDGTQTSSNTVSTASWVPAQSTDPSTPGTITGLSLPAVDAASNTTTISQDATTSTEPGREDVPSPFNTVTTSETASSSPLGTPEEDPLFDSAAFLSFEEWKKQNLAKTGQSAENVGQERPHAEGRQRPDVSNALDALGDESEISLDFSGFGHSVVSDGTKDLAESTQDDADSGTNARPAITAGQLRSKDAGRTCKERTNYASFDCSATMMKNNKECKHASSILVENKDSYMLNTCSADNKFVIVELCTDIHIDTIVLANYEFFSSIFRHFRVSVSDRYPAKPDKWKELGTFEARNTREVQAFLVEEPQIWARYFRIEFLTHYGSEYYCPVSLLRVHGRTMMQEFRQEEEMARGEVSDDEVTVESQPIAPTIPQEPLAATDEDTKTTAQAVPPIEESGSTTPSVSISHTPADSTSKDQPASEASMLSVDSEQSVAPATEHMTCASSLLPVSTAFDKSSNDTMPINMPAAEGTPVADSPISGISKALTMQDSPTSGPTVHVMPQSSSSSPDHSSLSYDTAVNVSTSTSSPPSLSASTAAVSPSETLPSNASNMTSELASKSINPAVSFSANSTRSPPPASPTPQGSTQESIFKSFAKRLQHLEGNSTDSLQYIEEQSRSLRDAFKRAEKRQIALTTTFLSTLNETVMAELHGFRQAYEQLWQGTIIELEGQKDQYQREMLALSSRLTLVADELVWQKCMGIVQSTLLLTCLGLVLFGRQGSGYVDSTLAQQLMSRSQAAIRAGWESDPNSPSPENRSPVSVFRRKLWRSSTGTPNGAPSEDADSRPQTSDGTVARAPFTPPAEDDEVEDDDDESQVGSEGLSRTQSSPPASDRGLKRPPSSHSGSRAASPMRDVT